MYAQAVGLQHADSLKLAVGMRHKVINHQHRLTWREHPINRAREAMRLWLARRNHWYARDMRKHRHQRSRRQWNVGVASKYQSMGGDQLCQRSDGSIQRVRIRA